MQLLKEIFRNKDLCASGATLCREAVRGIIILDTDLLMVQAAKYGAYKFPGGGILAGETHSQALTREIREECGADVDMIGPAFGKVIEYKPPIETEYSVFKMTSYYYLCRVKARFFEQALDPYEIEMDYQPEWINIHKALRINNSLEQSDHPAELNWLPREIFILEMIQILNIS